MKKTRRAVLALTVLALLAAGCATGAQQTAPCPNPAEARALMDAFMEKVARNDIPGAYGLIKDRFPIPEEKIKAIVEKSAEQRKSIVPETCGAFTGVEFSRFEIGSGSLIRLSYLERREKRPLRWEFILYNPKDRWTILNVTWDDSFTKPFESAR